MLATLLLPANTLTVARCIFVICGVVQVSLGTNSRGVALTFALDATRLPQTYSFTPSLDTQANRAYDKVANIATKVQSAYDMALSADGIAKGTRTTLVNKNGC
jgi:hypothetical protein